MSKQDLINTISKDRNAWPIEARICEHILKLTNKLRESKIMENYINKKLTLDDIEFILEERDNNNIIQDILNLKHEISKFCTTDINLDECNNYKPHNFQVLSELGTILATDCNNWWSRYETIVGVMGVECVLSIRTAESLFNRDPNAPKLKQILMQLIGGSNV